MKLQILQLLPLLLRAMGNSASHPPLRGACIEEQGFLPEVFLNSENKDCDLFITNNLSIYEVPTRHLVYTLVNAEGVSI